MTDAEHEATIMLAEMIAGDSYDVVLRRHGAKATNQQVSIALDAYYMLIEKKHVSAAERARDFPRMRRYLDTLICGGPAFVPPPYRRPVHHRGRKR